MQPSLSELTAESPSRQSMRGEPAWEIAQLFPVQGEWSEEEYLTLAHSRGVELSDGCIEVLPIPTEYHQLILAYLYETFQGFVRPRGLGKVLFSGLRVRLWTNKIREPDLVVLLQENEHLRTNQYWKGADVAVEIVSTDDPNRDLVTKRDEYAQAGIREYWIIDPRDQTIRLLSQTAAGQPYAEVGHYRRGAQVASVLLPGFVVDVEAVFAQDAAPEE